MEGIGLSREVITPQGFRVHVFADRNPVEDHPKGYHMVAAFLDAHPTFLIVRKFSLARLRILAHSQVQIASLEQKLLDMDEMDSRDYPRALQSWKHDAERKEKSREAFLKEFNCRLKEYGRA